ncbi:hypothetical protein [Citrobacter koseri]
MKSRAAVAFGPGLPLEIVEIDVAPPALLQIVGGDKLIIPFC